MLIDAFIKALRNLLLPGIVKLFLLCLLAYGVGWTGLAWLSGYLLSSLSGLQGPEGLFLHVIGSLGGGILAWFLFPLLYPILVSFFDDYMAEVIERHDYPQVPKAAPPFWPTFGHDVLFSLKAILINLLLLPFYLIPLVGAVLYYGVNGYLLGLQFFRMSAGRRVSRAEAATMQEKLRGSIFAGGIIISFCSTLPVLNLGAPLLGVATMLHLFHAAWGSNKVTLIPPASL